VLLDLLAGKPSPSEQVTLPHTLVVRASTAPPGRW
jgi:DNA-binding LacI/PurR family transcriptional regulator